MCKNCKDIVVGIISGTLMVCLLSLVTSHLSSSSLNKCPSTSEFIAKIRRAEPGLNEATIVAGDQKNDFTGGMLVSIVEYSEIIKWYDILSLLIVWSAGVFFNKSLHRVADSIFSDDS